MLATSLVFLSVATPSLSLHYKNVDLIKFVGALLAYRDPFSPLYLFLISIGLRREFNRERRAMLPQESMRIDGWAITQGALCHTSPMIGPGSAPSDAL